MLTIWGRADSSNVQAVMWGVGELGLAYTRHDVGHRFGGTDTPEFIAMNPNRLVPVVRDGESIPLWEAGAILRYLAGRYAPESFWPADPLARADVDRWAEWAKINITMAFGGPVFVPMIFHKPEVRNTAAVEAGLKALTAKLAIADARLANHPFLVGEDLTLADIHLGTSLYRYYTLDGITRPDLPALAAYYDRLCARPAYAEHVMVPYDALRPAP
jgi:Glutathione S-transferase